MVVKRVMIMIMILMLAMTMLVLVVSSTLEFPGFLAAGWSWEVVELGEAPGGRISKVCIKMCRLGNGMPPAL